jgi:hypothetical protein
MNRLIGKVPSTSIATKSFKNPTIECIHSSLPKNEKSHFGPQRTLRVKGTFEVLYRKKKDEEYDESKKELLAKLQKVQVTCHRYSGSRTKTMPWRV